jgi:hypothetical protein
MEVSTLFMLQSGEKTKAKKQKMEANYFPVEIE